MPNPFVHIELNTTNVETAKSFYSKLFNWKLDDVDMGGGKKYTTIKVGEGTGGGMLTHPMAGEPTLWIPYVLVDNIEESTQKARSLGAAVVKNVEEVMGRGWLSILADPTSGTFGLWKPKKM